MNVVIFEDEQHNAERLNRLLQQTAGYINVVKNIESVAEGRQWFRNHTSAADVAFMDIHLSDGNCFEMLEEGLPAKMPVIFTTAYDNYALDAFKVNSIDYLLKPIDPSDLKRALDKLRRYTQSNTQEISLAKIAEELMYKDNRRFLGKTNNQLVYVKAKDIAYVCSADGITKAVTFQNQKIPVDYTLEQMEMSLDKSQFCRINRNMIIHIDAIQKITSYYNSRLSLKLQPEIGKETIISRERVNDFKRWLEGKSE